MRNIEVNFADSFEGARIFNKVLRFAKAQNISRRVLTSEFFVQKKHFLVAGQVNFQADAGFTQKSQNRPGGLKNSPFEALISPV